MGKIHIVAHKTLKQILSGTCAGRFPLYKVRYSNWNSFRFIVIMALITATFAKTFLS